MCLLLSEYANKKVDLFKVLKMLIIHDIVEIDAGDTIVYDEKLRNANKMHEDNAAKRIFGMLPRDQYEEYYTLWCEFEKRETNEAKFAACLDRLEPVMQNYFTDGYAWTANNVSHDKVLKINAHIENGSTFLWSYAKKIINDVFSA